jgi:V/A-type H+-transporting ATPase subunit I
MAIAQMNKVMIVSHRSEAAALLEALQQEGIVQVLAAERAMVSKEWPELQVEMKRPRDIEEMVGQLDKAIEFLKGYSEKGQTSIFSPRVVIDKGKYSEVVGGPEALELLEKVEKVISELDKLNSRRESTSDMLVKLTPWEALKTKVEEARQLKHTTCIMGLLPVQHFDETVEKIEEVEAAIEVVGKSNNMRTCVVVCLNEVVGDVQKVLRGADFEAVSFEGLEGSIIELIEKYRAELVEMDSALAESRAKAGEYARSRLDLQILFDHYENLLGRENARRASPATEYVVLLEGWTKKKDYKKLEKIVGSFEASTVRQIVPGEGEEIPVEIDNNKAFRPFEVITRLYGMPQHFEVDPTVFLAPFFALFFGLCLTDAGYGLVMIALIGWFIWKMQGDKKLMWMLIICSVTTVVAGALTGGWFGDGIQAFLPALDDLRQKVMWFDPLERPMTFFILALVLGYIQLIFGLVVAFIHNIRRKDFIAAGCDQLTWLVMLNSILLFAAGKVGAINVGVGKFFGLLALVPAVVIVLFSQRQGGWGGRIGMGCFELFGTIFWMGDVLSYLRLMALGMVTAGLGLAINVITKIVAELPYGIGFVAAPLVFVLGHAFNLGMSGLSAFVHTLRLQYVEFFPKFIVGGGKLFEPLNERYKHIYVKKTDKEI